MKAARAGGRDTGKAGMRRGSSKRACPSRQRQGPEGSQISNCRFQIPPGRAPAPSEDQRPIRVKSAVHLWRVWGKPIPRMATQRWCGTQRGRRSASGLQPGRPDQRRNPRIHYRERSSDSSFLASAVIFVASSTHSETSFGRASSPAFATSARR